MPNFQTFFWLLEVFPLWWKLCSFMRQDKTHGVSLPVRSNTVFHFQLVLLHETADLSSHRSLKFITGPNISHLPGSDSIYFTLGIQTSNKRSIKNKKKWEMTGVIKLGMFWTVFWPCHCVTCSWKGRWTLHIYEYARGCCCCDNLPVLRSHFHELRVCVSVSVRVCTHQAVLGPARDRESQLWEVLCVCFVLLVPKCCWFQTQGRSLK